MMIDGAIVLLETFIIIIMDLKTNSCSICLMNIDKVNWVIPSLAENAKHWKLHLSKHQIENTRKKVDSRKQPLLIAIKFILMPRASMSFISFIKSPLVSSMIQPLKVCVLLLNV